MPNWLLYVHAPNHKDKKNVEDNILTMQKNLLHDVTVFVLFFGPTVSSPAVMSVYTRTDSRIVKVFPNHSIADVVPNLTLMMRMLLERRIVIDAVCMWCHGASWATGPFKKWKTPFLSVKDAVNLLIRPFHVPLVCFDACYQGGMSCLYELPSEVQVVVASPALQPFYSLLVTKAFGELRSKKVMSKTDLLSFAHDINCQWHDITKIRWKCMLVFDMKFVPAIAMLVKKNIHKLVFDKKSQIEKEDSNLHDLYAAARDVQELQYLISESIHASCPKCLAACNKRVRGMSMEGRLPRKWIDSFIETRWYREIVAGSERFPVF
jgi:hypothetical protein